MKSIGKLAMVAVVAAALTVSGAWAAEKGKNIHTSPPAQFKKVSSLVKLPDYLPELGVLYVDPATLPAGPFLGYDKSGKLVNVIYMIPMKQLDAHKAIEPLGQAVKGLKVDHTDLYFNPGHPGVEEPHYHIIEWLIGHEDHEKRMK